jgi:hypothetical protein
MINTFKIASSTFHYFMTLFKKTKAKILSSLSQGMADTPTELSNGCTTRTIGIGVPFSNFDHQIG